MVRLTSPIRAMGQYWDYRSYAVEPSRKTDRRMIMKYRMGLMSVRSCTRGGMLAIGVAKPERMMAGTIKRKAPRRPCCWVRGSNLQKSRKKQQTHFWKRDISRQQKKAYR
ncbi:hypothetical protein PITCH_A1000003 [uncultured Desulfobacterium sp.]|uniref:Uncharacterized protein n=1 Tax=uncultured Desulfobacterium sp. TaxID=201089 RepID=A0A445MQL1_9BACT|nr:hypothetical protein PITCH_A1000003 [uncultured Desulfobacterium sp.]